MDISTADPELPPLLPGLPHTPVENMKELLLQIIVRGLLDDDVFVSSRQFLTFCMYLGLEPFQAVKLKLMFYRGQINRGRLEAILYGAYIRRPDEDAPAFWQSWARVPN